VYQYPSWSERMVADAYTTFKQTRINERAARSIRTSGDHGGAHPGERPDDHVSDDGGVTDRSPEPAQHHPLTIEKHTLATDPTDWLSSVAMSHAEWMSRQNQGVWPEVATSQV